MLISLIGMESEHRGIEQGLSSFSPNKRHLFEPPQGTNDGKLTSRPCCCCFWVVVGVFSRANVMHHGHGNSVSFLFHHLMSSFPPRNRYICQIDVTAFPGTDMWWQDMRFISIPVLKHIWSPYYSLDDATACLLANTLCGSQKEKEGEKTSRGKGSAIQAGSSKPLLRAMH